MKFEHDGKLVCLQGEHPSTDMCELTGKIKLAKCHVVLLALQAPLCYNCLADETLPHISHSQQFELNQLLENFQQLF